MTFDEAKIRAALADPALPLYLYDGIDSTSSECRRRLAAGEARCLVLADRQTAGRGRNGKRFFSPPGAGLYMSLLLRPEGGARHALGITTYTAVRAAEAVETLTGKRCGIKWVNDLYFDGKKVCGILTEALGDAVIVGVGLNLLPAAVPPELAGVMGCLDAPGARDALAGTLARGLLDYVPGDASHMPEYRRRNLVLRRRVRFPGGEGRAVEILDDGGLVVETERGRVILRSGEISLTGIEGLK